VQRAQAEHALAVLLGRPASNFSIEVGPLGPPPPPVPAGLPAELLERRPDIAAAERRVAAANAQIGVATAAFFPSFVLSASGGFQGSSLTSFFSLPNRFWSLGAALAETIFDGGKRRALREQALASYDATVDTYRLSVLTAFQEVEDGLAALGTLELEATQQARAVDAAERLLSLARNRYDGGVTTYLEVVTAQNAALANERTAVDLATRRMVASVNLVRALGGGWRASELPSPAAVLSRETSAKAPPPAAR
jgi:NodT family efflux transporter outer membrane factor (OMF) lipoprotein